jgi:AbrB family looped-hinge helix DNA binding protein
MELSTAKITSKGQITLPKKVRSFLEVASGDTVIFDLQDNTLVIRKAGSIESLFGSLPPFKGLTKERVAREMAEDARIKK